MSRCLVCDVIAKHMYEVAQRDRPEESVGIVCYDCKDELLNGGAESGPDGSCGGSEACSDSVAYVALVQETVTTDDGVEVVTKTQNLLCETHFEELAGE